MSWRTQGLYKGLSQAEQSWLKDFDRSWDTKAQGRSHSDALDSCRRIFDDILNFHSPAVSESERTVLEARLIKTASNVQRFTIPRSTKAGWSIHLIMKCGKRVRAHFPDQSSASQAYYALTELSFWFQGT